MKLTRLKNNDSVQIISDILQKTSILYKKNDIYRTIYADDVWVSIWKLLKKKEIVQYNNTIDNKIIHTTRYYAHAIVNNVKCTIVFNYTLAKLFRQNKNINNVFHIKIHKIDNFDSYEHSNLFELNNKQLEKKSIYDIEEYFNNNLWSNKIDELYNIVSESTDKQIPHFKNILRKEKLKNII